MILGVFPEDGKIVKKQFIGYITCELYNPNWKPQDINKCYMHWYCQWTPLVGWVERKASKLRRTSLQLYSSNGLLRLCSLIWICLDSQMKLVARVVLFHMLVVKCNIVCEMLHTVPNITITYVDDQFTHQFWTCITSFFLNLLLNNINIDY